MKKKAFTVIELLISMVIMGTLSATILPRIGGAREETKNTMSSVDKSRELASYVDFDGYTFSSDFNSAWGSSQIREDWIYYEWTDITICGTEYVSNSNGAKWCITIQGKNVWATTTWAWKNAPSTSYWNYYQWWDNTVYTTSNYNSGNIQPDNAWWWGEDSSTNNYWYPVRNPSERRWPCDAWYHVPSQWEWYALMDMWAWKKVNWYINRDIPQLYTAFQMPYAGNRYLDGRVINFGSSSNGSSVASFWSSSPSSSSPRGTKARSFSVATSYMSVYSSNRAYGLWVRCFKD